ncbi:MAG TPA: hypothetical protein VGI46_19855, partial [Candidatus Acidoferrum sp.]
MGNESEFARKIDEDEEQKDCSVAGNGEAVADRRMFLQGAVASAAALALPHWSRAAGRPALPADEMDGIRAEIGKRHDEAVKR